MVHANQPETTGSAHDQVTAWTPDLSVGVDEIDDQHRELLDRIDRVLRSLEGRRAEAEIRRLLDFLEIYVVLHFGTEDRLMARTGYPAIEAHRREHERFLHDFAAVKGQLEAEGAGPAVAQAVSVRICGWLTNHIRTVDRRLGQFLSSRPAGAPRTPAPRAPAPAREPPSALVWSDDLSVRVDLIDQQHQELFRRVNKLLAAARKGLARHEVGGVLDFLAEYVVEHFEAEEAVMRASSYPDFPVHKAQHDALKRELASFTDGFSRDGANVALIVDLNRTLCSWLTSHVRKADRDLGQWLNRRAGERAGS
jgi:hemerythrin